MKTRILHVVPAMNIGGVEVGILKSYASLNELYDYSVFSMKGPGTINVPLLSFSELLITMIMPNRRPDVVVSSLWPGHIVGLMLSFIGIRWIPFFHSARSYGLMKNFIIRMAVNSGKVLMFDSKATRDYLGIKSGDPRAHLCPYVFNEINKADNDCSECKDFDIMYAGRICTEKRLDLVETYIERLRTHGLQPRIYLALAGSSKDYELIRDRFFAAGIDFQSDLNLSQIEVAKKLQRSRFFILLSDNEGFSMGTVEAVQCGCVPIVRPVGEIPSYLNQNAAIWVEGSTPDAIERSVAQVVDLWYEHEILAGISMEAKAGVQAIGLYVNEFSEAMNHRLTI